MSAIGTVDGSTSNALDHVTSPCDGSGASSTRPPPALLVTLAISMARRTRLAASSGRTSTVAAKPTAPSTTTRTPMPKSVSSAVVSGRGVVEADHLAADALDPELGRLAARGGVERGVGQRRELVGGERHQSTGVGWRSGSPAAV